MSGLDVLAFIREPCADMDEGRALAAVAAPAARASGVVGRRVLA